MNLGQLSRLSAQSLGRNRRDFALASIGIVVGIATLVFFVALGEGIRTVVLERIFVITQLEVVPKSYDMGLVQSAGLFGQKKLDDAMVERIAQLPGVGDVYPKMKLTFPSRAQGGKALLGQDMGAELIADGIPEDLVGEVADREFTFRDWEAPTSCETSAACPAGHTCQEGQCRPMSCDATIALESPCQAPSYCHAQLSQCTLPIPVVLHPMLLEVYNGSLHTAMQGTRGALSKMPKLSQEALVGFEFEALFGQSFLGRAAQGQAHTQRLRLVGFSDKAMNLGVTMPIGYVERLNRRFGEGDEARQFHSIVVQAESNEAVASLAHALTGDLGLALSDRYESAQRAGLVILVVTLVFHLISLVILVISAINIMHTFLMIISERRRELGLLRALGATKNHIRLLVLSEATALGLVGGSLGTLVGWAGTRAVDWGFARHVGDFPFKPESLFVLSPAWVGVAVGLACVFCWLGALLPAMRASAVEPAGALTGG